MDRTRNTAAIVHLAAVKSTQARQRVRDAISTLQQRGEAVNFTTVGKAAGVSKTFLYDPKHADLAADIRRLRMIAPGGQDGARPRPGKSEAAKDAQIARLKTRVHQLEQQVRALQAENEALYGKLAECQP